MNKLRALVALVFVMAVGCAGEDVEPTLGLEPAPACVGYGYEAEMPVWAEGWRVEACGEEQPLEHPECSVCAVEVVSEEGIVTAYLQAPCAAYAACVD